MPNGDHEGQARAERLRVKYAKHDRARQRAFDALPRDRELPAYREEMDSHSEIKGPGIMARLPIPRIGRIAIAFALAFFIVAVGAALVIKLL